MQKMARNATHHALRRNGKLGVKSRKYVVKTETAILDLK